MIDKKWIGQSIKGTNCWQFIVDYYEKELSTFLWPYRGSLKGREDKKNLSIFLDDYLNRSGYWQRVKIPLYPDLAMFDINGLMIHGGIVLGDNSMLHMRVEGSLVQSYTDGSLWKEKKFKNLKGFYHYRKEIG